MRDILFRAKRVDNGEWIYGGIIPLDENCICIVPSYHSASTLSVRKLVAGLCEKGMPETVGQFTGLTDKNGMKIFEGDICRGAWGTPFEVFWDRGHTAFKARIRHELPYGQDIYYYANFDDNKISAEIIGNIHDNPELLEGNK